MGKFVKFAVAALVLSVFSIPAFSWTGPQVSIDNKNGRRVFKICDHGGGCTQSTPFFLALNSQTLPVSNHDWTTFMYQARLQLSYVSASRNGVVPILQVHLLSTSDAFLDELAAQLNQLSPRPYLYVRLYLETLQQPGMERMRIANMQGQVYDDTGTMGAPWSLNEAWLAYQESEITRILNRIDLRYPGRVMGLNVAYENGGEWFFRPAGYNAATGQMLDWGADNMCATGLDGVRKCNLLPTTNDSGTQPGPIGRHYFYLDDYSSTSESGFCNWGLLPSILRTNCRAASVVERNNAIPGRPLPALGAARGVFLNPADTGSLRAAYYNRYMSQQNVNAIIRILTRAKQVTGNRILTSAFYGYQYELATEAPISGHNALTQLLASNAIDIVAGPYSYRSSRWLANPISPQGPSDSPRLGNKLWFDEDDTRTHLAGGIAFQTVNTLWDSIRILRRNVLTAGLHNRGIYFLDLIGTGWFGRPDMSGDSETLWANLHNAFTGVDKLQLSAPNRFEAQVAVFVDDLSVNYVAAFTPAGEHSYAFATDIASGLIDTLGRLGTPVKQYLLSDLLKSNLDLSAVKLAVVANAWNVPNDIRQAINAKLKTPGRTMLYIYANGYMNQDAAASVSNISALTGINVVQGNGNPPLSESFNINGQTVPGGPDYPLTPWFAISDSGAATLGTYSIAGGVSLARKIIPVVGGSYTAVMAAAPKLPLAVLRKLSEDAGVHHFTAAGDIVEAAGNMMILHAATSGYKTINFPQTMPRILETAIWPSDTLMCSYCSVLSQLPFNVGDTRAFRWTSAPIGNFELINGTTLEGWAADLDMPATSIDIHVYSGGPYGAGGTFFTSFIASSPRPDLTIAFGIPGNNGFRVNVGSCPSGTPLYAYAIDPELQNGDGNRFIGVHSCP